MKPTNVSRASTPVPPPAAPPAPAPATGALEHLAARRADREAAQNKYLRLDGPNGELGRAVARREDYEAANPATEEDASLARRGYGRAAPREYLELLETERQLRAEDDAAIAEMRRADREIPGLARDAAIEWVERERPRIVATILQFQSALLSTLEGARALDALHTEAAGLGLEVGDVPRPGVQLVRAVVAEVNRLHGGYGADSLAFDIGPLPEGLPQAHAPGW